MTKLEQMFESKTSNYHSNNLEFAARQALDALERASAIMDSHAQQRQDNAITALREALEKPVSQERIEEHRALISRNNAVIAAIQQPVKEVPEGYALISIDALKAWGKYNEVRNACQFTAEQAEQEPVAWIHPMDFGRVCETTPNKESDEQVPLYAAPVRTKDLTDDEIADIGSELAAKNCVSDIAFARAVIAADREKNCG